MKYDRNLVATIIENEFWDDLYNEIDDSVMNMEGQELDEAFETYVDYAELDQIENVKVVRVEQEEDDTCTIVRGILDNFFKFCLIQQNLPHFMYHILLNKTSYTKETTHE